MTIDAAPQERTEKRETGWKAHTIASEKALTPALLKKLLDCTKNIFNSGEKFSEERLRQIVSKGGKIFYAMDWRYRVVGFAATEREVPPDSPLPFRDGLYFSHGVVRESHRRRGIYKELNRARVGEAIGKRISKIFLATQNPNVELGIVKTVKEFCDTGDIVSYVLQRTLSKTHDGRPVTREKPKKCGIKEIDDAYGLLKYSEGETYTLVFTLQYP